MPEGIAYQNKDITSKILAEKFAGKSLNVYGFNLPKVKEAKPTNLPVIQADELRLDNLFLLEDGSLAIIDYESAYKAKNKLKYLNYVARIADKYCDEYGMDMKIKVLILYTADVTREQTADSWDLDSVTVTIQQAFLSEIDSEEIKEKLSRKIRHGEPLSDEEMMQFIILPLTCKGKEKKNEMIETLFRLSKDVKDEAVQMFLLSGILVFTDKVVDEDLAKKMKGWISMTKVARLFEEEKQQAIAKERQQARKEKQQAAEQTARSLLKNDVSIEIIMNAVPLTRKEIEKIQAELY